jgi:hypothetical protein
MEPHRKAQNKVPLPSVQQKSKRFRIVKLEERVAPKNSHKTYVYSRCYCGTYAGGCY